MLDIKESDRQFYRVLQRYSTLSVVALCVVLTMLWVAIVWRQNVILGRLRDLDATLQTRTQRFERIEVIEREQSRLLERIEESQNKARESRRQGGGG